MQLLIILVLVLLNGVLAMSEIAVVRARRARLQQRLDAGEKRAQAALDLSESPDTFLSTVQIGITLVGVVAGAFGGATVGVQFGNWLAERVPAIEPYSNTVGIALIVTLTTYLSLVLGELVPKRIGLLYPEQISMLIAGPMQTLAKVFAPVVWFLEQSQRLVLAVLPVDQDAQDESVSEAEIINMIQDGTAEGIFEEEEAEMVRNVFMLDDKRVTSIMTPRPDIVSLSLNADIDAIKEQVINTPHSFYPVCESSLDRIVGIIKAKDMLVPLVENGTVDIRKLMRQPEFIPAVAPASAALEQFQATGAPLIIVMDEHGSVAGMVTINDIIEEIVGDVDAEDPKVVRRADGSLLLDGGISLDDLNDYLPDRLDLPEEEVGSYQTLAGFVMARLGRMPNMADMFDYAGLRFEVVDMDGARIDRVLVAETPDEHG